jgi:hypothetical protein
MRPLCGLMLLTALSGTGCATGSSADGPSDRTSRLDPNRAPLNAQCRVQFKRDLLGGGAIPLPIGPTVVETNGASVSVSGKLRRLDDDWVVVDTADGPSLWVPRQNVLLLQFQPE